MPAGRHQETLDSNLELFPTDWKEQILNLYRSGASDAEVKALIHDWRGSFSNDLWYRWIEEEPIFSEAIKSGKILSQAWWEKEGRTNLDTQHYSYVGWFMNIKNRFSKDWKNSHEDKDEEEKAPQELTINVKYQNNKEE